MGYEFEARGGLPALRLEREGTPIALPNFAERIHTMNYGYNSSAYYFTENFDTLRERFARHGMEVSLERLAADRSAVPPKWYTLDEGGDTRCLRGIRE